MRRGECEAQAEGNRLLLSYWGEEGERVWLILGWERGDDDKLVFKLARRMNAELTTLRLSPRASPLAQVQIVQTARRAF